MQEREASEIVVNDIQPNVFLLLLQYSYVEDMDIFDSVSSKYKYCSKRRNTFGWTSSIPRRQCCCLKLLTAYVPSEYSHVS